MGGGWRGNPSAVIRVLLMYHFNPFVDKMYMSIETYPFNAPYIVCVALSFVDGVLVWFYGYRCCNGCVISYYCCTGCLVTPLRYVIAFGR